MISATATPKGADEDAESILESLLQDILFRVRLDDFFDACIRPAGEILRLWWKWRNAAPPAEAFSPPLVWAGIRQRFPRSTCFPLGMVAERAVRRLLQGIIQESGVAGGPALGRKLAQWDAKDLLSAYLALLLYECAVLNLRSSSSRLQDDYGFWYHWRADGHFRTLDEEHELRKRLWRACQYKGAHLFRAWLKHRGKFACPQDKDIDLALGDVFETSLAPRRGTGRRGINVLGLLEPEPAALRQFGPLTHNPQYIIVRGLGQCARVEDKELTAACGDQLDSRWQDLIDIATVFYLADIHVPRNSLLARDLVFLLPVRHPDLWNDHSQRLERVGTFLTGNNVEFRFISDSHNKEPGKRLRFRVADDERCVALFSGGLDSFVGAACAIQEKRQPVFVSHSATPALIGIQRRLLENLSHAGKTEHVPVRAGADSKVLARYKLGAPPDQKLYQHGRSFLFLSLAAAVALSRGIARLHVYENGPVALNPSFSEARINTRTTHPVFFTLFRDLIQAVFGVEIIIHNPFELMTKGEVCRLLQEHHYRHISATNSCWAYGRVGAFAKTMEIASFKGRHCGRCIPCVWRRAALKSAGLAKYDDKYLWDAIPENKWEKWLGREHLTVLLDLYRACLGVLAAKSDDNLLDLCPDLDEVGPGTLADRLALYRRYSQEIVAWFQEVAPRMAYRIATEGE